MRTRKVYVAGGVTALAAGLVLTVLASFAIADSGSRFTAKRMLGVFEVPAVSSPGASGSFEATLQGTTVNYTLSYSGLNSNVIMAHIHVAQEFASGGISVWLCETAAAPAPASVAAVTPTCDGTTSGTVTDSFTAAEVIGPTGQGITASEFAELLTMMRAGLTYANVHTVNITAGEVRGQLDSRGGDGDDDD
jgi:hypothetical protein